MTDKDWKLSRVILVAYIIQFSVLTYFKYDGESIKVIWNLDITWECY